MPINNNMAEALKNQLDNNFDLLTVLKVNLMTISSLIFSFIFPFKNFSHDEITFIESQVEWILRVVVMIFSAYYTWRQFRKKKDSKNG